MSSWRAHCMRMHATSAAKQAVTCHDFARAFTAASLGAASNRFWWSNVKESTVQCWWTKKNSKLTPRTNTMLLWRSALDRLTDQRMATKIVLRKTVAQPQWGQVGHVALTFYSWLTSPWLFSTAGTKRNNNAIQRRNRVGGKGRPKLQTFVHLRQQSTDFLKFFHWHILLKMESNRLHQIIVFLEERHHVVEPQKFVIKICSNHGRRPTPKSGGDKIGKSLLRKT